MKMETEERRPFRNVVGELSLIHVKKIEVKKRTSTNPVLDCRMQIRPIVDPPGSSSSLSVQFLNFAVSARNAINMLLAASGSEMKRIARARSRLIYSLKSTQSSILKN